MEFFHSQRQGQRKCHKRREEKRGKERKGKERKGKREERRDKKVDHDYDIESQADRLRNELE